MGSEIFDMTAVCGAFVKPDGGSMRSLSTHVRFFYPVISQSVLAELTHCATVRGLGHSRNRRRCHFTRFLEGPVPLLNHAL